MLRSSNFFLQARARPSSSSNSFTGQWAELGYPPVPISTASTPQPANLSIISSSDSLGNAGSNTPIGILRMALGDIVFSPDCDGLLPAHAVRGAAVATASRPVVVRKSLRLRELDTDLVSADV